MQSNLESKVLKMKLRSLKWPNSFHYITCGQKQKKYKIFLNECSIVELILIKYLDYLSVQKLRKQNIENKDRKLIIKSRYQSSTCTPSSLLTSSTTTLTNIFYHYSKKYYLLLLDLNYFTKQYFLTFYMFRTNS